MSVGTFLLCAVFPCLLKTKYVEYSLFILHGLGSSLKIPIVVIILDVKTEIGREIELNRNYNSDSNFATWKLFMCMHEYLLKKKSFEDTYHLSYIYHVSWSLTPKYISVYFLRIVTLSCITTVQLSTS